MILYTGIKDFTKHFRNAIDSLNSSLQKRTGFTSNEIHENSNKLAGQVFEKKYKNHYNLDSDLVSVYQIGQPVRIYLGFLIKIFQNKHLISHYLIILGRAGPLSKKNTRFSQEVYFIDKVRRTQPISFSLIDQNKNFIPTPFYSYQIQLAEPNWKDHRRINKILSKKDKKFLVDFKGESAQNKEWLTKTQLNKLKGNFR